MKRIAIMFTMILVFGLAIGLATQEEVYATNLKDSLTDIQRSGGGVIEGTAKQQVTKLSKDAMDLASTIVWGILIVSGIFVGAKFAGAGDNPQKKAMLKTSLIMIILGVIFMSNFVPFLNWSFGKFNLF